MSERGRLDVVLVHPSSRRRVYQALAQNLAAVEPPVWAGLMATYLRKRGYSVDILDAEAEELDAAETAQRVVEMDPLLTAVVVYGHQPSASTQTMPAAGAVCRALRALDPTRRTVLVGGHVAALPERTLAEEACDFVAAGEGPTTLGGLVEALKSSDPDAYQKVPGLWYRAPNGEAISTGFAPLVRSLDAEMPGMAWDLLDMTRYRAHNWHCFGHLEREPYAALYTSLGCPYHCSFCCIQAPFKDGEQLMGTASHVNTYRTWSLESILEQIDLLVTQHGVKNFKFADEMFVLNPRHIRRICEALIERNYGLNIWAYARVDTVRDDMPEMLKRAGFNWLAFGLESGSERVRAGVDKRFEQDLIYKTLEKVRRANISVIGNYIFGLPDDDLESMEETLALALDLNCEFGNFYSAMAYPGSQLYDEAVVSGWQLPEGWGGYSQHSVDTLPLPTKHLPASEVLRFRDRAFDRYFTDPGYLAMVHRKFGQATVDHIRDMTSHTLVRNNA